MVARNLQPQRRTPQYPPIAALGVARRPAREVPLHQGREHLDQRVPSADAGAPPRETGQLRRYGVAFVDGWNIGDGRGGIERDARESGGGNRGVGDGGEATIVSSVL